MANQTADKHAASRLTENGIFIRGVVISNSARKITKKDGNVLALVKHELALQPGIAVLERFLDPKENTEITIEGDTVTKYPKLKDFEPVAVKVTKVRETNGQLSTSSWDVVQQG